MTENTMPALPEEVQAIKQYIEGRIAAIESADRITPWNKAKAMAYRDVLGVISPADPPAPPTPSPEPPPEEQEARSVEEPAPKRSTKRRVVPDEDVPTSDDLEAP